MNERLKELYLRAHSVRHYDNDPSLAGNPPTVYWQGEVSAHRFAESIVFECIKLAVFNGDSTTGRAIKEYFGVE